MKLLRFTFNDGSVFDIDVIEFGACAIGALLDRLAKKHGGVKYVMEIA